MILMLIIILFLYSIENFYDQEFMNYLGIESGDNCTTRPELKDTFEHVVAFIDRMKQVRMGFAYGLAILNLIVTFLGL